MTQNTKSPLEMMEEAKLCPEHDEYDEDGNIPEPISEANACLIAAAPELLHALEDMCFMASHSNLEDEEKRRIQKQARAAIAKAKCETK